MKLYVVRDDSILKLIELIVCGDLCNVTVRVSNRDYACIEIYGRAISTIEFIRELGCREYIFPEKGDKK